MNLEYNSKHHVLLILAESRDEWLELEKLFYTYRDDEGHEFDDNGLVTDYPMDIICLNQNNLCMEIHLSPQIRTGEVTKPDEEV